MIQLPRAFIRRREGQPHRSPNPMENIGKEEKKQPSWCCEPQQQNPCDAAGTDVLKAFWFPVVCVYVLGHREKSCFYTRNSAERQGLPSSKEQRVLRVAFLRRRGAEGGGDPMHELGFQVAGSSQKLKKIPEY